MAKSNNHAVTFVAVIPPGASAIAFGGEGGGRIKLDFDDSQDAEVVRLLEMREQLLEVTVKVVG